MHHVYCPDEFAGIQDNNATTNYAATRILAMAQDCCQRLGREADPKWQDIIEKMWIPFDDEAQRIIQHEGFDAFGEYSDGTKHLKQADAILCVYPWEMPLTPEQQSNTVAYYRQLYTNDKIMMASAFDGIVDSETGDQESSWNSLGDLLAHFRGPFLHVSEQPNNTIIPFTTGIGGLLQLITMGWGGLRLGQEKLRMRPCLPKALNSLKLIGLHYQGKRGDITIDSQGYSIAGNYPQQLTEDDVISW